NLSTTSCFIPLLMLIAHAHTNTNLAPKKSGADLAPIQCPNFFVELYKKISIGFGAEHRSDLYAHGSALRTEIIPAPHTSSEFSNKNGQAKIDAFNHSNNPRVKH